MGIIAVRWKNWRLYRHVETDAWQLFDLDKDPKEKQDVANRFSEVVSGSPENTLNRKARWHLAGKSRKKKNIKTPARRPPKDTAG